jgi:hypothetical protein
MMASDASTTACSAFAHAVADAARATGPTVLSFANDMNFDSAAAAIVSL